MRVLTLAALLSVAIAGCTTRDTKPSLLTANPPRAAAFTKFAPALDPEVNIRPTELQRGEYSSLSLVQIRDREPPHIHTRYDLTVTLVRGTGTLWLNGVALPMRSGDVAFIPRNVPHYFVNQGDEPAAAIVTFAPAFSGTDQQPVP